MVPRRCRVWLHLAIQDLEVSELVPGDLIVLVAGGRVPVDAAVTLSAFGLDVRCSSVDAIPSPPARWWSRVNPRPRSWPPRLGVWAVAALGALLFWGVDAGDKARRVRRDLEGGSPASTRR